MTIDPLVALKLAVDNVAAQHGSTLARESDLEKSIHSELPADLRPERQRSIQLDGWEGRLGDVDIAVTLPGDQLVLIELKWGGKDALAACAWDVLKLATAQAEGKTSRAVLVAAAPATTWDRGLPGTEFFEAGDWELDPVLRRYESWFEFWRRDVANYPRQVAGAWSTAPLPMYESKFERDDGTWDIRVSEISAEPGSSQAVWFVPRVEPGRRQGSEHIEEPDAEAEERILRAFNPQRSDG